jgi:hypothetical protein
MDQPISGQGASADAKGRTQHGPHEIRNVSAVIGELNPLASPETVEQRNDQGK